MKTLGITYIWHGMADWDRVIADKPDTVIINPNSGPFDRLLSEAERRSMLEIFALVARLKQAGIKVLGYVPLNWTNRPVAEVINEANVYKVWYNVDGIFWDEAPTSASTLGYLRNVHGFARGKNKKGISVFNPGVMPAETTLYTFMLSLPGSLWCTFEGTESDYYQQNPKTMFYMSRQVHIVYQCNLNVAKTLMRASKVGYGFCTPDTLPNPFDTWPPAWYNLV